MISWVVYCYYYDAAKYIELSGNKIKTACVMAIKHCTKEEAELLLKQNNGILRKVI